jgi:hypothetical protein
VCKSWLSLFEKYDSLILGHFDRLSLHVSNLVPIAIFHSVLADGKFVVINPRSDDVWHNAFSKPVRCVTFFFKKTFFPTEFRFRFWQRPSAQLKIQALTMTPTPEEDCMNLVSYAEEPEPEYPWSIESGNWQYFNGAETNFHTRAMVFKFDEPTLITDCQIRGLSSSSVLAAPFYKFLLNDCQSNLNYKVWKTILAQLFSNMGKRHGTFVLDQKSMLKYFNLSHSNEISEEWKALAHRAFLYCSSGAGNGLVGSPEMSDWIWEYIDENFNVRKN